MHIILVSNRLATARTLSITPRLAVFVVVLFIVLSFVSSFLFSWLGVRYNLPFASDLVESVQELHNRKTDEYLRNNISTMAVKLGEMQAKVMQLDLLGERISKLSGVVSPKKDASNKDGQGGPLISLSRPLAATDLQREIDRLAEQVEDRSDSLTALESQLMERRIKATLLPTITPIKAERVGSSFGRRVDPILGVGAMHEGIDFVANVGTRVVASAGGVVVTAERHPEYGNLIEIDHGNGFSSRYAHLSAIEVQRGQIIKRGQRIAASGNTGRSTGPHLHFEVRFNGVAQDPTRFLQQGSQLALNGVSETAEHGKKATSGKSPASGSRSAKQ